MPLVSHRKEDGAGEKATAEPHGEGVVDEGVEGELQQQDVPRQSQAQPQAPERKLQAHHLPPCPGERGRRRRGSGRCGGSRRGRAPGRGGP